MLKRLGKYPGVELFITTEIARWTRSALRRVIAAVSRTISEANLVIKGILGIDGANYFFALIARHAEAAMHLYAYVAIWRQIGRQRTFQEHGVRVALLALKTDGGLVLTDQQAGLTEISVV